jgi:uncharacterized protein YegL
MVVTDTVPANMAYVAGSAQPPATFDNGTLRWTVPVVTNDWTASYRLRPLQVGTWPTNVEARSRFVDGLGRDGELLFPVPRVTVVIPPKPVFLPLVQRHKCWPTDRHADVALVLDTSSSMTGDKLAAAKSASRAFVEVLRLPDDQAAIIGFNKTAITAVQLTGDRARLLRAIDGLSITPGTVIDAGLKAATAELTSPRVRPGHGRVLVLMTDGQNNAGRDPVLAAARAASGAGITIYTVAFGTDADRTLMRQVAGVSSRAYLALGAEDLRRIYSQIAGQIGCDP